jgi:hypothetical protein
MKNNAFFAFLAAWRLGWGWLNREGREGREGLSESGSEIRPSLHDSHKEPNITSLSRNQRSMCNYFRISQIEGPPIDMKNKHFLAFLASWRFGCFNLNR